MNQGLTTEEKRDAVMSVVRSSFRPGFLKYRLADRENLGEIVDLLVLRSACVMTYQLVD